MDENHLLRRVKNISVVTSHANLSSRAGSSRAARENTRTVLSGSGEWAIVSGRIYIYARVHVSRA